MTWRRGSTELIITNRGEGVVFGEKQFCCLKKNVSDGKLVVAGERGPLCLLLYI
jgi:hypothetical protein